MTEKKNQAQETLVDSKSSTAPEEMRLSLLQSQLRQSELLPYTKESRAYLLQILLF